MRKARGMIRGPFSYNRNEPARVLGGSGACFSDDKGGSPGFPRHIQRSDEPINGHFFLHHAQITTPNPEAAQED